MPFYKTVPLSSTELDHAYIECNKEEFDILRFFNTHSSRDMSPCSVWTQLYEGHAVQNARKKPLTNVRRAITDLTDKGYLEKASTKIGYFGRKVNTWKLKSQN